MVKVISKIALSALCVCSLAGLTACEKVVIGEDEMSSGSQSNGQARLSVMTRAGDGSDKSVTEGRIYVFDAVGKCVTLLSTDENESTVTTQLPVGTYNVFAFGGEDLSRFTLPSQNEATTGSVIKLAEGKEMDDLFFEKKEITLTDGENENANLTLSRKVIQLTQVEIKDVPKDVTAVDVTISSFYSGINMDGTYPTSPTKDYTVSLTKDDDGTTWSKTPYALLFPSAGNPTISVTMTTANGNSSYAVTCDAPMEANHKYSISGTNLVKQDVSLAMSLTAADWDEDVSIPFNFDESNVTWKPEVGKFANGYFVLSVDQEAHKAVLMAKDSLKYDAPAVGAAESLWIAAITPAMAALAKPSGISNEWRLPTIEEARIFTKDTPFAIYDSKNSTKSIFCLDGDVLNWAYTHKNDDDSYEFRSGTNKMAGFVRLWPVIDIDLKE